MYTATQLTHARTTQCRVRAGHVPCASAVRICQQRLRRVHAQLWHMCWAAPLRRRAPQLRVPRRADACWRRLPADDRHPQRDRNAVRLGHQRRWRLRGPLPGRVVVVPGAVPLPHDLLRAHGQRPMHALRRRQHVQGHRRHRVRLPVARGLGRGQQCVCLPWHRRLRGRGVLETPRDRVWCWQGMRLRRVQVCKRRLAVRACARARAAANWFRSTACVPCTRCVHKKTRKLKNTQLASAALPLTARALKNGARVQTHLCARQSALATVSACRGCRTRTRRTRWPAAQRPALPPSPTRPPQPTQLL